tara:strand:+ start:2890 stop:3108 length:219 start_codon:yes stop_codon:yes gene_type:complete
LNRRAMDDSLEIQPGDSVIVIRADGTIGKVIMAEVKNELDKTPGYEKVIEVLELFNPQASVELIKKTKTKLN